MCEYNACIIFSHLIQHLHYSVQEKLEFSLKQDDLEQLLYVKHRMMFLLPFYTLWFYIK